MLGGVTMNIIVALIIYASIIYFNGRDVIKNENLPHGLAVAELMQDYGFQKGDKIVGVNGKELVDVMEINRYLLLRNVNEVQVLHQSGSIQTLPISDYIRHKLFEAN